VGDKIVQLTWKSRLGLVYDKDSFEQLDIYLPDGRLGATTTGGA
jgi:glutamine cyclotransferase